MYSGQNVLCGTGMYKSNNFKLELKWIQLLDQGFFSREWAELAVTDKKIPAAIKLKIIVEE